VRSAPNVAARRFALVWRLSLLVRLAVFAALVVVAAKLFGGL
jgi:hypothetical protein